MIVVIFIQISNQLSISIYPVPFIKWMNRQLKIYIIHNNNSKFKRTLKQLNQTVQMSSLEEDIFFGSKQHLLDSYLKARQEEQKSGFVIGDGRNVVYPNILDDISYQPSFKQETSGVIGIKKSSIVSIKSQHNRITEKIYMWIEKLELNLGSVSEGACLEININLGNDNKITEYIFYSRILNNSIKQSYQISEDFLLNFINQSVLNYFQEKSIRNLQFSLINKQSVYDKKVGNAFLPIESIVSYIQNALIQNNSQKMKKQIRLKVISRMKTKKINYHDEQDNLTFWLCLGKNPKQRSQTKKITLKNIATKTVQLTQKRKIKLSQLQIKSQDKNSITIIYQGQEIPFGQIKVINIQKNNKVLKQGIIFEVREKGIPWGKIHISALHIFLQDNLKGKYPIQNNTTRQCAGFITIQIDSQIIINKQINHNYDKNNTVNINKKLNKNAPQILMHTCISTKKIYAYGQKFSKESRYYVLFYYKNGVKKSKEFKFQDSQNKIPFLYESSESIEFIFSLQDSSNLDSKIEWELHCRELDYDRVCGFSQFHLSKIGQFISLKNFSLDCLATDSQVIIKLDMAIGTLRYEQNYFVENKIDDLLRLFRWDVRRTFIIQNRKGLYKEKNSIINFKQNLRKRIQVPFIQLEKFIQLTDIQEKGIQSQFIKNFLQLPYENSAIYVTSIIQFIKELHYLDYLKTGYVLLSELKQIFKYYGRKIHLQYQWWNIQNKQLLVLAESDEEKKDIVLKKRGFYEKNKIMFSYVPFLVHLEEIQGQKEKQMIEELREIKIQQKKDQKKTKIPQWEQEDLAQELQVTIIKAKNLNRINSNLKSLNSLIKVNQNQNSQIYYRDNNPEYNYKFRARGSIKFSIFHRDIKKGRDQILTQVNISREKLQKYILRKENIFIININTDTSVEIQFKKARSLTFSNSNIQ